MTTEEPLEKHDGGGPVDVPPSAPPMSAPAPDADDDQDGPCTTSSDTKTAPSPGPRAARLRELFTQSLRHTLAKIASWDQFSRCYPTMAVAADGLLRQVQAQMVEKLSDKCEREFDNILAARHVVAKLNRLEDLVADATQRRDSSTGPEPTPPHLLPPSQILDAHLSPALIAHRSALNAKLQTTQAQNALLHDLVLGQRAQIQALLQQLDAALDDVRGANRALLPVVGPLAREATAIASSVDAR